MPNVSDAFGPIIAAALSSKPPRANTAEAALAQVVGGSTPTEAESRYFEAFQNDWRQRTNTGGLVERVHQLIGLYVAGAILSRFTDVEKQVGLNNSRAMKLAYQRFRNAVESEVLSALAVDADVGLRTWHAVIMRDIAYVRRSTEVQTLMHRVTSLLLTPFANRVAAAAVRATGMSASELTRIADIQVREIVHESSSTFFKGAEAAVSVWEMPIVDPDNLGDVFGLSNDLLGGISSVATTVASIEGAVIVTTATVLNVVGIGLVLIAAGFAVLAYLDSVKSAEEAVRRQRLQQAIRTDTIALFESLVDGITQVEDALVLICAVDAMKAGIDIRSIERDALRRFIWGRMFPNITPPTLVAVTAAVTEQMNAKLTPALTPK